jgi:hypothetical protein
LSKNWIWVPFSIFCIFEKAPVGPPFAPKCRRNSLFWIRRRVLARNHDTLKHRETKGGFNLRFVCVFRFAVYICTFQFERYSVSTKKQKSMFYGCAEQIKKNLADRHFRS